MAPEPGPERPHFIVMTAVGPDRPGLVNEITRLIHAAGANLEDSRMAILGGEFALLLLISGARTALDQVESQKQRVEALGLSVVTKWTERPLASKPFLPYLLKVSGFDRPGIVHQVSELLAKLEVNVQSLESRVAFAPLSGTPMFVLEAQLQVPGQAILRQLRHELMRTCDEVDLDFSLEALG